MATEAAVGCVLAHSLKLPDLVFKKGRRLQPADLLRLRDSGITEVVVAQLEGGDVPEDEAATQMAECLGGALVDVAPASNGRANLFAREAGLARIDATRILAVNSVHESLTVATLPDFEPVRAGQMLATVKIIPYAAPRVALDRIAEVASGADRPVAVAAFCNLGVGLISTRLPGTRDAALAKMRLAVVNRLVPLHARLLDERVVPHAPQPLAEALGSLTRRPEIDVVLIFGIAATVDRADIVPTAIALARGRVERAGMPVDPGNLLVLGSVERQEGRCTVVGIPTCARSPKLNGFDFVLRRLAAGLAVSAGDIVGLGVGGLLSEIPSRPMPRDAQ